MKNIKQLLFLVLFFTSLSSQSQDFSMIDEIKKQMSETEQEELTKAEVMITSGDDLIEAGEKLLTQAEEKETEAESLSGGKKKKALKSATKTKATAYEKLVAGQNKYAEANKLVYTLYKKNLKTLKENHDDEEKISQIEELENEANTYFAQATSARNKAKKQEEDEQIYSIAVEAEQLETDAISIQIQAYSIYYGWFEPDEGETVDVVIDEIKTDAEIIAETKNQNIDTTKKVVKEAVIVFRIQIAASAVPLSMTKLRQIYPSDEQIFSDIDGEWYKYLVGNYKSYEDAYNAKKKMGVKGAFIVAYKDNVRVKSISEVCSPQIHPKVDKTDGNK